MKLQPIKENSLLKSLPANSGLPSIAADLDSIRPRAIGRSLGQGASLGVLGADVLQAYKLADPHVQSAHEIYKFAKMGLDIEVGAQTDAFVQAGMLTWKGAGTLAELSKDEPDYVKVAIGGIGAAADAATLLQSQGLLNINPFWSGLISTGCSVFLRYLKRDREQLKVEQERLSDRIEPKLPPQFGSDDAKPEFCRIDLEPRDLKGAVGHLPRKSTLGGVGLIGLAALGRPPAGKKGVQPFRTEGSAGSALYLSAEPFSSLGAARLQGFGTLRNRKAGIATPASSARAGQLREQMVRTRRLDSDMQKGLVK